MKPIFETIRFFDSSPLRILRHRVPSFAFPWHFHPEFELTLILRGEGKRFVGDHTERFSEGDLVLVGKNVPHVWLSDEIVEEAPPGREVETIVVHFSDELFGESLLTMPEFERVARLLHKSQRGIKIRGKTRHLITDSLLELENMQGIERFLKFIALLDLIEEKGRYKILCQRDETGIVDSNRSKRLRRVDEYLMQNYYRDISVADVASVANMNTSAFCRYFKGQTQKTFSQYLNELRISYACKLLINDNFSIARICYECGFNSLSYFNRQFKLITKKTPKMYRAEFKL